MPDTDGSPSLLARFRPFGPLLLIIAAASCFEYGAVPRTNLAPGREVRITITPDARATLASQIGTQVRSVTGQLRTADSSGLTLAMTGTTLLDGTDAPWSGEVVTIPVSDILVTEQRKISSGKTIALVVLVSSLTALVALSVGLSTSSGGSSHATVAK